MFTRVDSCQLDGKGLESARFPFFLYVHYSLLYFFILYFLLSFFFLTNDTRSSVLGKVRIRRPCIYLCCKTKDVFRQGNLVDISRYTFLEPSTRQKFSTHLAARP